MEPKVKPKENAPWDRLWSVIQWSGMSTNHFARHIGLANGENLYRIKRGLNGISVRLAETVVKSYPEINGEWLRMGRGTMFNPELMPATMLSFYSEDVERFIKLLPSLLPKSTITMPTPMDAEIAMLYMGDAMGEAMPANTIVVLKKVDVESVIYGKEYVVVCEKFSILRMVRSDEQEHRLRLRAVAREKYDDILINRDEVQSIYRVVARIALC